MTRSVGAAGLGFCVGLSGHLLKDALLDGNQTVRFHLPFLGGPGTIMEGSYLDDDAWLGLNGLAVFKPARDVIAFRLRGRDW